MPGRFRNGMLVIPAPSFRADRFEVDEGFDRNGVYVIREILESTPSRARSCNTREGFHSHQGAMRIVGLYDWYCWNMFEPFELPPCRHLCKPFCVCLASTLAAQHRTLHDAAPRRHATRPSAANVSNRISQMEEMERQINAQTQRALQEAQQSCNQTQRADQPGQSSGCLRMVLHVNAES